MERGRRGRQKWKQRGGKREERKAKRTERGVKREEREAKEEEREAKEEESEERGRCGDRQKREVSEVKRGQHSKGNKAGG